MKKKLPIGIQSLRELREEGHYYADKSGYAVDLAEQGKYYFLRTSPFKVLPPPLSRSLYLGLHLKHISVQLPANLPSTCLFFKQLFATSGLLMPKSSKMRLTFQTP